MVIRFILETPNALVESALNAVEAESGAEALTVRRSESYGVGSATTEITVVAEDISIVDTLYNWWTSQESSADVFVNMYQGDRYSLHAYDPNSLRKAIATDVDNAPEAPLPARRVATRAGNSVTEIPYGGRMTDGSVLVPATSEITLSGIDHIALRVRDIASAERFYRRFFAMNVIYRAYLEDDRWEQVDENYDWEEGLHTGIRPEIVRLENGPVALVLLDIGGGKILHENRIGHFSVQAPAETMSEIRGRALFHSFTIQEDTPVAFRFVDPYGMVWQIVLADPAT